MPSPHQETVKNPPLMIPEALHAVLTHPAVMACIREHHFHVSRLRYNADILSEAQKFDCASMAGKALQDAIIAAVRETETRHAAAIEALEEAHAYDLMEAGEYE